MSQQTNTLSIIGMILGILGIVLCIIPCTMILGVLLAIAGLILSIVGYKKAKDTDAPTTIGLIGIIASGLALIIGLAWGVLFAKGASELADMEDFQNITYETCDDILDDMEKELNDLKSIESKGDDAGFGDISKVIQSTRKMIFIQQKAEEMGCNDDEEFKKKMDELEEAVE